MRLPRAEQNAENAPLVLGAFLPHFHGSSADPHIPVRKVFGEGGQEVAHTEHSRNFFVGAAQIDELLAVLDVVADGPFDDAEGLAEGACADDHVDRAWTAEESTGVPAGGYGDAFLSGSHMILLIIQHPVFLM